MGADDQGRDGEPQATRPDGEAAERAFERLCELQQRAEDEPDAWPAVLAGWQAFLQREDVVDVSQLYADGCLSLAIAFVSYYEIDSDDTWAQQALTLFEGVEDVFTREEDPQSWAMSQFSRGNLHLNRHGYHGRDSDVRLAEQHYQQALKEYRRDVAPTQWAMVQYSLGALYSACYERSNDPREAAKAEAHSHAALAEYRRDVAPREWAIVQNGLGNLYLSRAQRTHDRADVALAEQHFHAALDVQRREVAPLSWAKGHHDLGTLYLDCYELDGQDADARAAERCFHVALEEYRRDIVASDWGLTQHRLGDLFTCRFIRSADRVDAERAEGHYLAVLAALPRDDAPTRWADAQHSLGDLYLHRFEQSGADADARAAATHYEAALAERSRERAPADWAMTHSSLGSLHARRYERSGDTVHARLGEQHYQAALAEFERERSPAQWALTQYGLGTLHLRVSERSDDPSYLEAAERHLAAALEEYRPDVAPVFWSAVQHSLGNLYLRRHERDGAEADAERAEQAFLSTLAIRPREEGASIQWATAQYNLGTLHARRFVRTGDDDDARRAEQHYRAALGVYRRHTAPARWATTHHSLGALYVRRHGRSGAEVHADRACRHFKLVLAASERHPLPAMLSLRAGAAWTRLLVALGRWEEAANVYPLAARALETLVQAAGVRESRESWLREVEGLAAHAAYALARLGRPETAVEVLEDGRARLLAGVLETRRSDLERLNGSGHGDRLSRFRAASTRLAELQAQAEGSTAPEIEARPQLDLSSLARDLTAAQAELAAAVAAIREVPGFEDFFAPTSFKQIRATGADAVIYLATTAVGGVALVMQGGLAVCWFDNLTEARLREVVVGPPEDLALGGYLGAYDRWKRVGRGDRAAEEAWRDALDGVTRWLWDAVMGPLLACMHAQEATLIPSGLLGLLPLHAAWTEDAARPTGRRHALDDACFRYAPSAAAARAAQATAARVRPTSVLAVDDPDGSLVCSGPEVAAVLAFFPADRGALLRGGEARREAVLAAMPRFAVHHFATHGWSGWDEPLHGGLLMAQGEPLTLAELLELRLGATRLMVLSACETGLPGTRVLDEVVGLPATFLQAGVAGIVASMWRVNDLSCAMLMERFYHHWLVDGRRPAEALRAAQRWLRDTTNREKAEYFRRDIPALAGHRMPEAAALALFNDRSVRDPDARSFAHPFWWAAFSLTGV